MWTVKEFKTAEQMNRWIQRNQYRYQIEEIFINQATPFDNRYAVQWRPLRRVY